MEIFAERIRELREVKRYSQADVAERLNISQSYYARFETGKGEPNLDTLVKLADLLDTSIDYLVGRDNFLPETVSKSEFNVLAERIRQIEVSMGKRSKSM